jgi:hypothetical protein
MDADWISIADWARCIELSRPGIVFEIRNAEGLSLFTPCVMPPPEAPFDWKLPPLEFRAVPESAPEHSDPIPLPRS